MTPKELLALGETLATLIAEATAPLLQRIADLEGKLPGQPADLPRRLDALEEKAGHIPVDFEGSLTALISRVQKYADEQLAAVSERVGSLQEQVAALPAPKDGLDGKSVSIDDVRPLLAALVAELPRAKDGEPGPAPTPEQIRASAEAALEPLIDRYALQFERRAHDVLMRAVAALPAPKDGAPGKDGRDALDLEDFEVEARDGGREFVFRLKRGELLIERSVRTGLLLDAGPYKDGTDYLKGSAVTFGGSLWVAQRDTNERPKDVGSDAWRCAVRRGRDGRDGEKGAKGDRGEKGERGLSSLDVAIR